MAPVLGLSTDRLELTPPCPSSDYVFKSSETAGPNALTLPTSFHRSTLFSFARCGESTVPVLGCEHHRSLWGYPVLPGLREQKFQRRLAPSNEGHFAGTFGGICMATASTAIEPTVKVSASKLLINNK